MHTFKFTPPHRKLIIALLLLLLTGTTAKLNAQNEVLDSVNLQLRQLFSPLARPSSPKLFLYDMAAHVTDSAFYTTQSTDTLSSDIWHKIYEEMYHGAYDTTLFTHPDLVYNNSRNFGTDTIPIGIINYSFYTLKSDALTSNTYFDFDTVNTTLTDKYPRPSFPYNEGTIFSASPLLDASHMANPIFRVDPQFIFFDSFNSTYYQNTNYLLQINFDDGNGWITFNPTIVTNYQVTYGSIGPKNIQCKIVLAAEPAGVLTQSLSRLISPTLALSIPPDALLNFPGIKAGLYSACNARDGSGKIVIYVSGFDLLENRSMEEIYADMLRKEKIIQLKNQGYSFLVVDWKNSRIDMRFNALHLVNLLQELKATRTDDEQFVIMGESMGGVIARYALTYMETQAYQNHDVSGFFQDQLDVNNIPYLAYNTSIYNLPANWNAPEKMHNTRLLITLDAPHQGANVPLSIQKGYRHVMNIFGPYVGRALQTASQAFNILLDGQAAQQLLIYHVDTESGLGFYKTYSRHPDGNSFYTQMAEMGNYPQFAKVVLMSNGALNGEAQTNFYTNQPRQANDRLFSFNLDTYAKILGIKIPLFGGNITARTNPNGQGEILNANAGRYTIKIKLKWFGIKIYAGYNSLLNVHDYADVKPYCTSSGGYFGNRPEGGGFIGTEPFDNSWHTSANYWLLDLFHYDYQNNGAGCLIFNSHLGWNGFASINLDWSICTDGFQFCFVPTQSALDYGTLGTSPALGYDIQNNDNINTKLASIPANADVMIGYPGNASGIRTNRGHVNFRNPLITNLASATNNTYFSCVPRDRNVQRGMLNLEIGDEELYLENNVLPWRSSYSVEYDLHVNDRNPRYEYPSQPFIPSTIMLEGVYSKDNDFTIASTGFATFIFDRTTTPHPTGIGFNFNNPSGSFTLINQPLDNCCRNFVNNRSSNTNPLITVLPNSKSYLNIYPNPNAGNSLTLTYKLGKQEAMNLEILNLAGQRVLTKPLYVGNISTEITTVVNLTSLHLSNGIYIIKVGNAKKQITAKLVISK